MLQTDVNFWLDIEDHLSKMSKEARIPTDGAIIKTVSKMSKEVRIPTDGAIIDSLDCSDAFNTTEVTDRLINLLMLPAYDHKNLKFYLYFRFSLLEMLC